MSELHDPRGLFDKYQVVRRETGEEVRGTFTLRPEVDPAARVALEAYARAVTPSGLADDLFQWLGEIESEQQG